MVYTNLQSSGAYRGFGATQGTFAVESTVNELAETLGMDPTVLRDKNMTRQGRVMHAYGGNETASSCALDRCMSRCREIFDWENRYPVRDMGNGKVRAAGVAMGMQGSSISGIDVGSATVILSDDGTYNLLIGAADMGTGCDTTLAQIAAETLGCSVDDIAVLGADTDYSPYDSGSYASSTTFITGKAVEEACLELKERIRTVAAEMLGCSVEETAFENDKVTCGEKSVSLTEISYKAQSFNNCAVRASSTKSSPTSPPPFMVGMAEIELDKLTGVVKVLNYAAVVDCGRAVNPAIARVQTEGGIAQGIGMALLEDVTYDAKGRPMEDSLMQYRIPTRQDVGHLRVEFEDSYEDLGPYGAKSIGEIVINTPSPAIAHAIYRATGAWQRELPITPQKVAMSIK